MDKARKFLSKSTNISTDIDHEKCDQHDSENVFFCKKHAKVGCGRCLMKDHATCGPDIIDLADVTKEMVDTKLAKHIKSSMENMSDNILQIEENLSGSQSRNKTSKEACLRELNAYKKKIDDRIEKQTKNAKDALTDMYNKGEEDIKIISGTCSELKQKITSKKIDFEASIRNNQYKKQYILMTTLKKELETLTTEVEETKQRSITKPISLVCNIDVKKWLEEKGSDFIAKASLPPPPKRTHDDPTIECSSDIDYNPDCGEMRVDDILSCLRIGQGNFGEVFKGLCKPMNATVVVKVYKDICTDKMRQTFATQMTKLRTFDHPNLVKYLGIVLESQPIRIVMEYVTGQCLLHYLRSANNKQTHKEAAKMCLDIATGMEHLIANGCLHTLLAARNCFITDESVVKISDYGISNAAAGYTKNLAMIPVRWSAPEIFRQEQQTAKSDVWSYGVVMWEIFSKGDMPHPKRNHTEVRSFVLNEEKLSAPKATPDSIYHIMKRCWAFFPRDRIPFEKIIEQIDILIKSPPSTEQWS